MKLLDVDEFDYIIDLAKKHTNELGFIPEPRLRQYYRHGQILVEHENDEPCGYLCYGNDKVLKIYQACIQYDARRKKHGIDLVESLIKIATKKGCEAISLWCADDLDANKFWESAGFVRVRQKKGGKARNRMLNQWVLSLPKPLFEAKEVIE